MSMRNENAGGTDFPPEYCQYNDTGCEFSETCLNCPLPLCVYEEPGGKQRFIMRKRALEMARLFHNEGKSIRELSGIFKVSKRTVQRALKAVKSDKQNPLSLEGRGKGEGDMEYPSPP
jgi:hypothetical protein